MLNLTFFLALKAHQNSWRTKWCRSYKRMWLWKKTLKRLLFSIYISTAVNSSLLPLTMSFRTILLVEEKCILMTSWNLQFCFIKKNSKLDAVLGSACCSVTWERVVSRMENKGYCLRYCVLLGKLHFLHNCFLIIPGIKDVGLELFVFCLILSVLSEW